MSKLLLENGTDALLLEDGTFFLLLEDGGGTPSLTLTGPSSGLLGLASSNFTVTLNAAAGDVVFTPTASPGTGSFTPATRTLTIASPAQTFTYTPTSAGARNINGTNDGGIVGSPADVAFTVTAPAIALSGPATSLVNNASTNFTVTLTDGNADTTFTPTSTAGTGSFTPSSIVLTAPSDSDTFTYTPTDTGVRNIGGNNTAGFTGPTVVAHEALPVTIPTINAERAYVVNLDNDTVYYSKGTGTRIPASIAKLMTCYVLRQNKTTLGALQQTVTIVSGDLVGGSGANLLAGDIITYEALLYNAMLPSSNDSCAAIARNIGNELSGGGGVTRFVTEMNTQAAALGMNDTTWVDAWGLSTSNLTTPEDIVLLLAQLYDDQDAVLLDSWFLDRYRMSLTRGGSPTVIPIERTSPVYGDIGVVGGKGGSLSGAVNINNLAILWEAPNGQTIAVVAMDAATTPEIRADIRTLIAALPTDYPALATPAEAFTPAYLFDTLGFEGGWWDPTDTDNLWQNADGTTPVTTNDHPVGKWSPKAYGASTSTLAFTQSVAGSKPLWKSSDNRLTFDGTNDFMTLGAASFGTTGLFADAGQEFVAAFTFGASDATSAIFSKAGATAGNRTFQAFFDNSVGAEISQYVRGQGTNLPEDVNDGSDYFVLTVWDGVRFTHTTDGIPARQLAVGTAVDESGENIILGARTDGTATFLTGDFKDVILADGAPRIDIQRRLRDWFNGGVVNAFADPLGGMGGPATAIEISGPSSGDFGVASTNFTVSADGDITGTITVTLSATGGCSFSPTSVQISSGSPTATFTFTPSVVGAQNINATNDGGLDDPANHSYTATATGPGAPTNVVGTYGDQQISVTGTAPDNTGNGTITGYIADDGLGGHTTVSGALPRLVTGLTNGVAYTVRLKAVNAVGEGPWGTALVAVTPSDVVIVEGTVTGTGGIDSAQRIFKPTGMRYKKPVAKKSKIAAIPPKVEPNEPKVEPKAAPKVEPKIEELSVLPEVKKEAETAIKKAILSSEVDRIANLTPEEMQAEVKALAAKKVRTEDEDMIMLLLISSL